MVKTKAVGSLFYIDRVFSKIAKLKIFATLLSEAILNKKPFDANNLADVMERVLRMKPRSFSDEEIRVYLNTLIKKQLPRTTEEAVRILRVEEERRR
jgi:hypothetical protein